MLFSSRIISTVALPTDVPVSDPTGVSATADEGRISLAFTDPNGGGADSMQIAHKWNADGTAFYEILEHSATVSSPYVNTYVKNGLLYDIRMRLEISGVFSNWVEVTSVRPSAFIGLDSFFDTVWNTKRLDTLFTDTARTTKSTKTSDAIAGMDPSKGTGNLQQSTAADRPTRMRRGFAGVDTDDSDFATADTRNFVVDAEVQLSGDFSVVVTGRRDTSRNLGQRIFERSDGGVAMRITQNGDALRVIMFNGVGNTTADITLSPAIADNTNYTFLVVWDDSAATMNVYDDINGTTPIGTDTTSFLTGYELRFDTIGNTTASTQMSHNLGYVAWSSTAYTGSNITNILAEATKWHAAEPEDHDLGTSESGETHLDVLVSYRNPTTVNAWQQKVLTLLPKYIDHPWTHLGEISKNPITNSDWIVYGGATPQGHGQDDIQGTRTADSNFDCGHHYATRATQYYLPATQGNIGNGINIDPADSASTDVSANGNGFFAGHFAYRNRHLVTSAHSGGTGDITVEVDSTSGWSASSTGSVTGVSGNNITADISVSTNRPIVLTGTVPGGVTAGKVYQANDGGTTFALRDPETGNTVTLSGTETGATVWHDGEMVVIDQGNSAGDEDYTTANKSFQNAQHRMVLENLTGPTRVHLSGPLWSSNKAIGLNYRIREHVFCDQRLNWKHNETSACPVDGSGRKYYEAVVAWFGNNMGRDKNGTQQVPVANVVWYHNDVDVAATSFSADYNNDGTNEDRGVVPSTKEQIQYDGLIALYQEFADQLPNQMYITGGTGNIDASVGQAIAHGAQLEAYLESGSSSSPGVNTHISDDGWLNRGDYWINVGQGPWAYGLGKFPNYTYTYDETGANQPATDRAFRYHFGMALITGFGRLASTFCVRPNDFTGHDDPWEPLFGVDVRTGEATYGQCMSKADKTNINNYGRQWMGHALGPRERVQHWKDSGGTYITLSEFAAGGSRELATSVIATDGISAWSASGNTNVSLDTTTFAVNTLKIEMTSFDGSFFSTRANGPSHATTASNEYYWAFQMGASGYRDIKILEGNFADQKYILDTTLRWIGFAWEASGSSHAVQIQCGRWPQDTFLAQWKAYSGNPNVFQRYFQNCRVIVNATRNTVTVPLGGRYLMPDATSVTGYPSQGGIDPDLDGTEIEEIQIGAKDAVFLIPLDEHAYQ